MENVITATYSPEDNKLRLYAEERLDTETFARVKEAGFSWAPVQKLFVAPKWTPEREDLCLELAGDIMPEESTMVERAELKAARLDNIAVKRANQANSFSRAAKNLAQQFSSCQPILSGHHSEGRARRDHDKIKKAQDKAQQAADSIQYWQWKATGVERHANRKADPTTRARRIKTLLAELRDYQRDINHAKICLLLWGKIADITDLEKRATTVKHYVGSAIATGYTTPDGYYSAFDDEKMTADQVIDGALEHWDYVANSAYKMRMLTHILNRLGYEQSELGSVLRFEGTLSPVILQAFAREHGAHKPEATKTETGFILTSSVDLPAHLGDSNTLDLTPDEWRDLMQASGYTVPAPKERKVSGKGIEGRGAAIPLINPTLEDAEKLQARWNATAKKNEWNRLNPKPDGLVASMPQAAYSARSGGSYSPCETVELDINGDVIHRSWRDKGPEAVCKVRAFRTNNSLTCRVVHLTDKPAKALNMLTLEELEPAVKPTAVDAAENVEAVAL